MVSPKGNPNSKEMQKMKLDEFKKSKRYSPQGENIINEFH